MTHRREMTNEEISEAVSSIEELKRVKALKATLPFNSQEARLLTDCEMQLEDTIKRLSPPASDH